MSNERGFTLIETLVAALVGVIVIVAVGTLGGTLIRHRSNADSVSGATSLAQMQLETLRSDPQSNPDALACGSVPRPDLCAGTHGPYSIDASGGPSVGGPYEITWQVIDGEPAILPGVSSKRLIVEVTHTNNPYVTMQLETYLQVAGNGKGT